MLKKMLKKVENPSSDFRGAPFWAWNAKLEPEELRRQIRLMKEMGLGGFFMHSRVGLNTEYLGKDWFDCVRACIDEAGKLNMNAWLYDEDRWPSGAAGGFVTKNPRYRIRFLHLDVLDSSADLKTEPETLLGLFAAHVTDSGEASGVRRLSSPSAPLNPGEKLLCFSRRISDTSSWFNNQAYLDTMNKDAVREFVRVTHEAYKREIGSEFGRRVPGIFTDEPNFGHGMHGIEMQWTDSLPEVFLKTYHYDLAEHLPELFYVVNGEEFSKVRLDYFNLITDLFVKAFCKEIGDWCAENHLAFTGHMLCEDTLISQRNQVGAAMRTYEYMQAPGIDLLTEHWLIFNTAKQCVSMAHQFGRETRLSETYGCTGWDFPFLGHKALGDWQLALGINLRCQHLAWYSMAAQAKRDYPASIFYQSPWYREYSAVENYFAHIGAALSEGEEVRDLLVIHPIESVFGTPCLHFDHAREPERNLPIVRLTNELLAQNLDFDFGDEEVMSRHASVQEKKLVIAKASYKAVLIPELRTIRSTTLEILKAFAESGATVAFLGKAPALVDGIRSEKAGRIFAECFKAVSGPEMISVLAPIVRTVSIRSAGKEIGPTLYQMRRGEDFRTIFICNVGMEFIDEQMNVPLARDRKLAFPRAEVLLPGGHKDKVYELHAMSGVWTPVDFEYKDGSIRFDTSFAPLESRCFLITKNEVETKVLPVLPVEFRDVAELPAKKLSYSTDDPNVLVLDKASFIADGSGESAPMYFIPLDDKLRELLGKPARGGAMCQPWLNAKARTPERKLALTLNYRFVCRDLPEGPVFLAMERPDLYRFAVNGKSCMPPDVGFWCDLAIRKLELPSGVLRKGENVLSLSCDYHELLPGIESLFLLGNFGVEHDCIVSRPASLDIGDWCAQGFSNYAGNLTYTFEYECSDASAPLYLTIPEWRGAALGVRINDTPRELIPWPPYTVSLSGKLKKGCNRVEITVFGHRRNAFGPFYLDVKWPAWTGPAEFKRMDVPERQLVPCGLLSAPKIQS